MDYKTMMINQSKSQGRLSLHPYAIGVITSIVSDGNYNPDKKVNDISLALEGMDEAWNDKSLPWDYVDTKKPSTAMESDKEINQLDCTIDLSKVEPFLKEWTIEQILRNEG